MSGLSNYTSTLLQTDLTMKNLDITVPVKVLEYNELSPEEAKLVDLARRATYRSYAPYSNFKVGAAILLENGEIITGSNQENAAFPSSTCAERTACYYAHSQFPGVPFKTIVIAARGTDDLFVTEPIPPCGGCRQALIEYETLSRHNVPVILVGHNKIYRLPSVHSLLPLAFTEF